MSKKDVCIIGIGAIGSVVSRKLNKHCKLTLIDRDYVEESNLFRQPFYKKSDIGKAKAEAASKKLNGSIGVMMEVTPSTIKEIGKRDIIICCTDDIESKMLVNDYCKKEKIQLITGSAIADRGMVFVNGDSCFSCVFRSSPGERCDIEGILIETSRAVGEIISNEAIKILNGEANNELIYVNITDKRTERFMPKKNLACKACIGEYIYLDKKKEQVSRLCDGTYIIRGLFDFRNLSLEGTRYNNVLHHKECTFFSDNRAFIKADDEKDAIRKLKKILSSV
ncbi:MAG: ThiF family adenylyltransferase [Candidatus Woesearchaeota archaeon]|nr:ThiF family adenylyltransferase [Candidatus Woesearchaeota archaeon]